MKEYDPIAACKCTTESMIKTKADAKAVESGCYYDADAAIHVVNFFSKYLKLSRGRGAGEPFKFLPWQIEDIIKPVFGWKKPDGTRRIRRVYIEIPKKNGKSSISSGLALYLLCADGEPGAEVYSAATTADQAKIVYREAMNMVKKSPHLSRHIKLRESTKWMGFNKTQSFYKAISSDTSGSEGLNASAVVFDELHALKNRSFFDSLEYAGTSRVQPLFIIITTAGHDKHSICYEQRKIAKSILDGDFIDQTVHGVIYTVSDPEKWKDPDEWRLANPSFGYTMDADTFETAAREAIEVPTKENSFKRYRLNIWTEQDVRWLSMHKWALCPSDFEMPPPGAIVFGGLDLSSTTDLSAFAGVWKDGETVRAFCHFWCPEENAREREEKDRVPYSTWKRQGFLTMTPGDVVDYDYIRHWILKFAEDHKLHELAIDRWNATQITTQLIEEGISVVPFGQGYKDMSPAAKEVERLVTSARLNHGGNPIMEWMARNAAAELDPAGNIKPSKKKSTERIDGIVALCMAIGRMDANPEIKGSIYRSRGAIIL